VTRDGAPGTSEPGDPPRIESLVAALETALAPHGFDLVAHTTIAAYHATRGDRGDDRGFLFGEIDPSRAVIVVGNSRAAWPHFLEALEREPERRREEHPFDRWTTEIVSRAVLAAIGEHAAFDTRYAFEGGRRAFSALHLAHASGLAHRGPASLAVHPRFGPWFALRAAVLVDVPGRVAPPPDPICERCREKPCLAALARALSGDDTAAVAHQRVGQEETAGRASGRSWSRGRRQPADGSREGPTGTTDTMDVPPAFPSFVIGTPVGRQRWRAWLEVRDACPIGVAERYPDGQIRWHYAHDRSALG
jgi:methylmalonic aciduria homocystinuria type C protein